MQRYHAGSCTSAVNNTSIGGPSTRDLGRIDSSSLPTNFPASSRRQPPPPPPPPPPAFNLYKLKCDKEPLNSRLGPPDFNPQTPNCPEETLTKEYLQSGYRDTVEGLEEAREILLTQIPHFNKTTVLNCKEAIRKRLKAINESRVQKRKAGQVYGVALSESQLSKPGVFPEQRPCPEDFRKKWIEGLSQQHKRLRSLADLVPQYRRKSVLEVLIRNNVPLPRATWFVKVTYLNLVRPGSANVPSGTNDKTQLSCSELWTKDIIEYLQTLLDDFFSKNTSHSTLHNRDRSPQMPYTVSLKHRSNQLLPVSDSEEPSLHFRWWFVVRLLQWHHAEGLLVPSLVIDWVLHQLQEKQLLEIWQLLLPIVYGFLEMIVLSQTYVRILAGVALRIIRDPAPGGSDLVDNSRRAYTASALIEMLRYLILAVPETFVALDCFPLPSSVVSHAINDGSFVPKVIEAAEKIKNSSEDVVCIFKSKGLDARYESLAFDRVISCIQKHAENLTKAVSPGCTGYCLAKAAQALDRSLVLGDMHGAYKFLFEDQYDGPASDGWIAKVSPCLKLSLKWFVNVNTSLIYSVFFLCEWATCDFRNFRTAPPCEIKFTGKKDISQVHIAVRLLKMKLRNMHTLTRQKNEITNHGVSYLAKCSGQQNNWNNGSEMKSNSKSMNQSICSVAFESPGPLHDIIVCWIDQHMVHKGEGLKRLHLFIVELIRAGIFYPLAYVRQLIVSGIMDTSGHMVDLERQKRHSRILKQLPGNFIRHALEESEIIEGPLLNEALHVYLNERRLILRGSMNDNRDNIDSANNSSVNEKHCTFSTKDEFSTVSINQRKAIPSNKISYKVKKVDNSVEDLKTAISVLLQLPNSLSNLSTTGLGESQSSVKRPIKFCSKVDLMEATPGCEECKRAKKQKLSEERSSFVQAHSPILPHDEDTWWVKKGLKSLEPLKVDQLLKATKQVAKSRQKTVRKTQSLAQLAASRIEGSLGASTSHVCEIKVSCPHHRNAMDGDTAKSVDGIRTGQCEDIVSTGKALKRLRFVDKKEITVWLMTLIRQLIGDTEKSIGKVGQFGRSITTMDDRSSIRWKLGEDELSAVLYLMDVSDDLVPAIKFLLWLLPKVCSSPSSTIHNGRNVLMLPRNVDNQVCNVGEAFLLSSLRRYENILATADLIPEALSSVMHRAAAIITSSGRVSGSGALAFARYLLKKYSNVVSVIEWEKNFKTTFDKRLASELESGGRLVDGEFGLPLGVPAGVEDPDDYFRQKISGGRLPSRVGSGMRDVVHRNVEDAFQCLFGKDRKFLASGTPNGPSLEKWDNGYQIAQQIVISLMDCIRQTGGAAQEGDPSLVTSAVSAIVGSVGPSLAKLPDFSSGNNHPNISLATSSLNYAKCILRMHITCLCLLKEALGERQSRVFDIALATEASNALAGVFAPSKASRNQFQISPETYDTSAITPSDLVNSSSKIVLARTTKIAASVSALIVGAIIYGVTSLERMVTVLRLKEGLDVVQYVRSSRSNSNGNARSVGAIKGDSSVEVHLHWFRLLVGNCRTICEGLVVDLLSEPSIVALSRMQRMLPLSLVFPPAYSIFTFVMWRPFIMNVSVAIREDSNQLCQTLTMAISDALKHLPFRDVCLRDSQGLYDLMAADTSDLEFATLLELNGSDMRLNSTAFVPLRARLFLNAMVDCKMPEFIYTKDGGSWISGHGESKINFTDSESKLQEKLVDVLEALQPAKFHWQWVELRLLLNELALIEKLQTHDMSLSNAIKLSSPSSEKTVASENENNFIQIILTRLLVRPDAAPLFSELIHLFGKSLEDSMLMQAKWFLGGPDVLFGRKTIRQRLINIAETKGLSVKPQFSQTWGSFSPYTDLITIKRDKRKVDSLSLEEGEVVEGVDVKRPLRGFSQVFDSEGSAIEQLHGTERAFLELILPCIDQSSDESRYSFASDLIKQLSYIEQQIAAVTRGPGKPAASIPVTESPTTKANTRKTIKGGIPGLARRPTSSTDSSPPSPAALRASMSLRIQLIMRFLPILYTDGEPSVRNMRHTLASVILRLLGSQIVIEDANILVNATHSSLSKKDAESPSEVACAAFVDSSIEGLFDRLLLILHGLLSSNPPIWLRLKPVSKTTNEPTKKFSGFDRELLETLQNHLDCMQLPDSIRWHIQAAMPVLPPSPRCSFSCQPPSVPNSSIVSLQLSIKNSGFNSSSLATPQRSPVPLSRTAASGKSKQQDNDFEFDPWTLLEDGAGSCPSASNVGGGDCVNIRAASWLKGAVRVRRTDLTYVGAVDEDS